LPNGFPGRTRKVKWEDFAGRFQIVRLGQLPKASFEEANAWLTDKIEAAAKRSA
jgi:hypothetical protein